MRKPRRHGRGYSATAAWTAAPRARRVSRRSRRADLVRRRFLLLGTVLLMALAVAGANAFGWKSSGQQPRAALTQRAERFIPFRPAGGRPSLTPARRAVGIDVYAADRPGQLSPVVRGFPSRIYVPNSNSDTVDVIDPAARISHCHVPHHTANKMMPGYHGAPVGMRRIFHYEGYRPVPLQYFSFQGSG